MRRALVAGGFAAVLVAQEPAAPPKVFATDQPQGGDTLQLSPPRSVDASDCQGNRHGIAAQAGLR